MFKVIKVQSFPKISCVTEFKGFMDDGLGLLNSWLYDFMNDSALIGVNC